MFELRCVVKDKSLGDALRALKPIALEPPVVIPVDDDKPDPVANVGHSNGHRSAVKAKRPKRGPYKAKVTRPPNQKPSQMLILDFIKARSHTDQITRQEMVAELEAHGLVAGSQTYAYNWLRDKGVISPSGVDGIYNIHREKAEQHG